MKLEDFQVRAEELWDDILLPPKDVIKKEWIIERFRIALMQVSHDTRIDCLEAVCENGSAYKKDCIDTLMEIRP